LIDQVANLIMIFGEHSFYIIASYVVAFAILSFLAVTSWVRYKKALKEFNKASLSSSSNVNKASESGGDGDTNIKEGAEKK
jgi:heme exporter protein CcmD